MQLFVYGSLLRGMSLSSYMEGTRFLGPAYVKADMFYLGFYPGIINGENIVYGELYEVSQEQLPVIDEVEDYIELDNERSAYLRRPIDAFRLADGKKVRAEAYFYNRSPEGKLLIDSGDYRQFMTEPGSNDVWLIGYGSYMGSKKMLGLLGTIPEHRKGVVEGFDRVYTVKTGVNGSALANLQFTGGMQGCNAVAWRLNKQQLKVLDDIERISNNYFRISMPFVTNDGEMLHAQTYMANIKRIKKNLHPDPHYLELVKLGMIEHGFV
jgi:gamma-glutamylcyclotransferase (GGCT)/AIG2-like uncharacterized protein YtfP